MNVNFGEMLLSSHCDASGCDVADVMLKMLLAADAVEELYSVL